MCMHIETTSSLSVILSRLEEVLKQLEEVGNASETEVHLPHARNGVLGAHDLPGGHAAN